MSIGSIDLGLLVARDDRAWRSILTRYRRLIVAGICRGLGLQRASTSPDDMNDLVSGVVVKLLVVLPRFDAQRTQLSTWLYQVARRVAMDHRKATAARRRSSMVLVDFSARRGPSTDLAAPSAASCSA